MQPVTINNTLYNIPISWDELNYWQGSQMIKNVNDKGKQLSILSKIPIDLIDKMPDLEVQKLFTLISFTENLDVFDSEDVIEEYKSFDFGNIEYGSAEKCRKIMQQELSGFEVVAELIKHLVTIDINEMPFLKVIGTANFFLSKLIASIIVSPSLAKIQQVVSNLTQVSSDSKNLGALERMLKLQEVKQSETQ